jgi:CheY-like chemotaxis protein
MSCILRLNAGGLLEDHGFGVVEAENADAALKLLETRDDVRPLFTDIQMLGSCNGMDLARRFVCKPYRANELLGEVDDLLRNG